MFIVQGTMSADVPYVPNYAKLFYDSAQGYRALHAHIAALHKNSSRGFVVDIHPFVDALHQYLQQAIGRSEVWPYVGEGAATLHSLRQLRDMVVSARTPDTGVDGSQRDAAPMDAAGSCSSRPTFYIAGHGFVADSIGPVMHDGMATLDACIGTLANDIDAFAAINHRAMDSIRLWLSYNPVLEGRVPMSRAQIAVHDNQGMYSIIHINVSTAGTCSSPFQRFLSQQVDICGKPRTLDVSCIDDALAACDKKLLSTTGIAHGAQHFPLIETAIPVIVDKYRELVGLPSVETHYSPRSTQ